MTGRWTAPSWGALPRRITLYRTPGGWRHSILTETGGRLCGGLSAVSADASDTEARSAATTMLERLALDFHGTDVDISWHPSDAPDTCNGVVARREAHPD
ncbi:hypothetical protein ABH931_007621 [Streptacidiphilus sp. MAP12-33]|uniref:hypothetical protein n=1 Tax=Streptacidiphilus sp. MAP12-33 TaxID=3156266 RepID=UPI0035168855